MLLIILRRVIMKYGWWDRWLGLCCIGGLVGGVLFRLLLLMRSFVVVGLFRC